jgi:uroporphyrinogen-III synthase
MSQTSILSTKTLSDVQRQAFLDANFDLLEQTSLKLRTTFSN